jgi:cell shape-determining protein MreD
MKRIVLIFTLIVYVIVYQYFFSIVINPIDIFLILPLLFALNNLNRDTYILPLGFFYGLALDTLFISFFGLFTFILTLFSYILINLKSTLQNFWYFELLLFSGYIFTLHLILVLSNLELFSFYNYFIELVINLFLYFLIRYGFKKYFI